MGGGTKKNLSEKIFGQKKIGVRKKNWFGGPPPPTQNCRKKSWLKKMFGQKFFWAEKLLVREKNLVEGKKFDS